MISGRIYYIVYNILIRKYFIRSFWRTVLYWQLRWSFDASNKSKVSLVSTDRII
jgi:hypothetical protein